MMRRALLLMTVSWVLCAGALASESERPRAKDLREDIARILARPEYQQPDLTWLQKITKRVWDWLASIFVGLEPVMDGLYEAWPVLYWVIVALLVTLLALLIYHIIWTLAAAFGGWRPKEKPKAAAPVAAPDDLRARAARLAGEGKYAEAIVALYEALIRYLDRKNMLRYDASRTNWEYLDAVRSEANLFAEMEPLTRRLDPILYGGARPAEGEYRDCEALVDRAWAIGGAET